ncbi:type II toxin-antitoxin system RelE/ParE family toxin [Rhodoplanes sp. SY1]|uniref:type II toxin-antitoxin system RelE/ParE family toxin n=1 Tax=Rhodoplanes sp. SY1 TaxID=3166646 RepID=UPI0038B43D2B
MGKVTFTHRAREDLLQLWLRIAPHNIDAADRVYDQIERNCGLLRDHPQLGPARPEIGDGARALIIGKWIAFYRELGGGVQVVRVMDGTCDLTKMEWAPERE